MQRERRQTASTSATLSTTSASESTDTHSTGSTSSATAPSSSPSLSSSSSSSSSVSPPASSSVSDKSSTSSSVSHDVSSSTAQSSSSSSDSSASSSSSNAPTSSTHSPPNTPSPSSTPTPPPHASPSHLASSQTNSRLPSSTLTTFTTLVSGQLTTVITPVPTALSPSPTSQPFPHRVATITGTALAVLCFLLLLLLVTFIYRRHRRKLRERLDALIRGSKGREHRGLLDGEDFFDEDEDGMGMKTYRDVHASATLGPPGHTHHASASSTISSTRTTTPVGIPPLAVPDTFSAGLGGLVDSVMGRRSAHSPEPTATAAPETPPPATTPLYIDPFRPGSAHEESVYFDLAGLPPSAAPPVTPTNNTTSQSKSTSPTHTTTSPTSPALQASTSSSSTSPLPPGAAPPRRS